MKINYKSLALFFLFLVFTKVKADNLNLQGKFIPLKDFVILKYELFFKENAKNVFQGGGVFGVAYQDIIYDIKIKNDDSIDISINAIMDKERYRSKRYYPKLRDCNQVRNKIFMNKYGYSFLSQSFNNLVNEESLTKEIKNKILNISSLDNEMKNYLLNKTNIKIKILHPKQEKSLSCSGKLLATELE